MKRFLAFIVLVKLLFVLFIANSYAATGAATVYKVTMKKLELCTASTGYDNCEGSVTIGEGDKVIDIAAVDAAAVAGTYGKTTLLPLGVTYTHLRVTIDRGFVIKSAAIDAGTNANTDDCKTIATTDAQYVTDEATDKYTHVPVIAEGGTNAEQNLYLPSDNYYLCANLTCGVGSDDQDMTYSTDYATFIEQHAEGDTTDDHVMVYELTSPYTVALLPPTIDIGFGTQLAAGAYEISTGAGTFCHMWAEEPKLTITIK